MQPSHSCFPYGAGGGSLSVLTEAGIVDLYEDGKKTATASPSPLQAAQLTV